MDGLMEKQGEKTNLKVFPCPIWSYAVNPLTCNSKTGGLSPVLFHVTTNKCFQAPDLRGKKLSCYIILQTR